MSVEQVVEEAVRDTVSLGVSTYMSDRLSDAADRIAHPEDPTREAVKIAMRDEPFEPKIVFGDEGSERDIPAAQPGLLPGAELVEDGDLFSGDAVLRRSRTVGLLGINVVDLG